MKLAKYMCQRHTNILEFGEIKLALLWQSQMLKCSPLSCLYQSTGCDCEQVLRQLLYSGDNDMKIQSAWEKGFKQKKDESYVEKKIVSRVQQSCWIVPQKRGRWVQFSVRTRSEYCQQRCGLTEQKVKVVSCLLAFNFVFCIGDIFVWFKIESYKS